MNLQDETRLESQGAVIESSLVPWDSEIFGFPVAQITRFEIAENAPTAPILAEFETWCATHDVRLISCRLDHLQIRESMILEDAGFRFVETVYVPRFVSFTEIAAPTHDLQVAEATPQDTARIEDVAYAAFTTGRFLLDHRLPPELSRRRYANWVRTSFGSANQIVLKAESEGDLVGFFIVEHRPDKSVYWHLTAIAPGWQGKGMGIDVWRTMLLRHRAEGVASVETTISGHNLAVINLYARLGFSFASAQMTFHRLREPEIRP
jgi:RimJ/RimL family protein N-acetyltransferase